MLFKLNSKDFGHIVIDSKETGFSKSLLCYILRYRTTYYFCTMSKTTEISVGMPGNQVKIWKEYVTSAVNIWSIMVAETVICHPDYDPAFVVAL
jgi:hypothetical protein